MAQFPAMPLWTDAYLGDTHHLTTTEHGAYLLLLMTMWRNRGTLPNDDRQLCKFARLTPSQWARIKPTLWRFFTVDGDTITQGRLTDEVAFVKQHSAKQSNKAKARWLKEKGNDNAVASNGKSHGNAPTPSPSSVKKNPPSEASKKPAKRAAKLPDDFSPDLQPAIDEGLQPQEAILSLARFKDHAAANGRTQIDWMAAWRLWYRGDIQKKQSGRSSRAQAPPQLHPVIEEAQRRKAQRNADAAANDFRTIDHDEGSGVRRRSDIESLLRAPFRSGQEPE